MKNYFGLFLMCFSSGPQIECKCTNRFSLFNKCSINQSLIFLVTLLILGWKWMDLELEVLSFISIIWSTSLFVPNGSFIIKLMQSADKSTGTRNSVFSLSWIWKVSFYFFPSDDRTLATGQFYSRKVLERSPNGLLAGSFGCLASACFPHSLLPWSL